MTCVLARPAIYSSPCTGHTVNGQVQNIPWEDYDYNWISSAPSHQGSGSESRTEFCSAQESDTERDTNKLIDWNDNNKCARVESKCQEMCLQTEHNDENQSSKRGVKRKTDVSDLDDIFIPPKRISPFLNTPKEKKEEKRKILKISLQKIKCIEDAELSLRRSVLINNIMNRMKRELRKETKSHKLSAYNKKKQRIGYGMLNNDCLSDSYLVDDPFLSGVHEKITDDMTDILMNNLENKIGSRIACLSSVKDKLSCNVAAANTAELDECTQVSEDVVDSRETTNTTILNEALEREPSRENLGSDVLSSADHQYNSLGDKSPTASDLCDIATHQELTLVNGIKTDLET